MHCTLVSRRPPFSIDHRSSRPFGPEITLSSYLWHFSSERSSQLIPFFLKHYNRGRGKEKRREGKRFTELRVYTVIRNRSNLRDNVIQSLYKSGLYFLLACAGPCRLRQVRKLRYKEVKFQSFRTETRDAIWQTSWTFSWSGVYPDF